MPEAEIRPYEPREYREPVLLRNHPPPDVVGRTAEVQELPGGAVAILKAARAGGYSCWATYARGWVPGRRKGPTDSVLVKGTRSHYRVPQEVQEGLFVAEYLDGKAEVAYFAEPGCQPERIGFAELKRRISGA